MSFIWQAMLTDYGVINTVLGEVGLGRLQQGWLDTPNFAIGSIVAVATWQYTGFCAVIYLAAPSGRYVTGTTFMLDAGGPLA